MATQTKYPWDRSDKDIQPTQAVGYVRVSSRKQVVEGDGLKSQETMLRAYASARHFKYRTTFPDEAVSGGEKRRAGFDSMLAFLRDLPKEERARTVVLVTDLKRLARDRDGHWDLRREISELDVQIESPLFKFSNTPSGKYFENILAATNEYEKDYNRDQVLDRQRARLMNGYWPFKGVPHGYEMVRSKIHGKIVEPAPKADQVGQTLENFAFGRLATQSECARALSRVLDFEVSHNQVKRMLKRAMFYAGYIEYPRWNVSRRKGRHKALISLTAAIKITERLASPGKRSYTTGYNPDFPLKGYLACPECRRPYRAYWAKAKYPVYECKTKGCPNRETLRRDDVDKAFLSLLRRAQPTKAVLSLAKEVMGDTLRKKELEMKEDRLSWHAKVRDATAQIDAATDRLTRTEAPAVLSALERKITTLEERRSLAKECLESRSVPNFETALDSFFTYLKKPADTWKNGGASVRKQLMQLAFVGHLSYDNKHGFRTVRFSLPFQLLQTKSSPKGRLVDMVRQSSNQILHTLGEWQAQWRVPDLTFGWVGNNHTAVVEEQGKNRGA